MAVRTHAGGEGLPLLGGGPEGVPKGIASSRGYIQVAPFSQTRMASSVVAQDQGRIFQARIFWLNACRLFRPDSNVCAVGFEVDDVKSFDDVAAYYEDGMTDELGKPLRSDHYSCKYHVTQDAMFTSGDLMDPNFIGATRISFLQRLHSVQKKYAPEGFGARFSLVTTGSLDPQDPLARFIDTNGGYLRDDFWNLGDRSARGKIRKAWREHLGLSNDDDLKPVLRPLRFDTSHQLLTRLGATLRKDLELAGFRPPSDEQLSSPYDDLPFKLTAQGRKRFLRDDVLRIARAEKLWLGTLQRPTPRTPVGVRSFARWAEWMEDETADMVCLVRYFGNRVINAPDLWSTAVYPEVEAFAERLIQGRESYLLYLDAHTTVAFIAGYCLDPKCGIEVTPVQAGPQGRTPWVPDCEARSSGSLYVPSGPLPVSRGDRELLVALSVTHDIRRQAEAYAGRQVPTAAILHLVAAPQPSSSAVRDGTHAWQLAQEAVQQIRSVIADVDAERVHLLAAAPNGLMFFLGRMGRSLGPLTIHEYDFHTMRFGAYRPALSFPVETT